MIFIKPAHEDILGWLCGYGDVEVNGAVEVRLPRAREAKRSEVNSRVPNYEGTGTKFCLTAFAGDCAETFYKYNLRCGGILLCRNKGGETKLSS